MPAKLSGCEEALVPGNRSPDDPQRKRSWHLVDVEPLPLLLVHQDVVDDGLLDGREVVVADFFRQTPDQLLHHEILEPGGAEAGADSGKLLLGQPSHVCVYNVVIDIIPEMKQLNL